MLLPHRVELELPHPLIGTIITTIEEAELGAPLPAGGFTLAE